MFDYLLGGNYLGNMLGMQQGNSLNSLYSQQAQMSQMSQLAPFQQAQFQQMDSARLLAQFAAVSSAPQPRSYFYEQAQAKRCAEKVAALMDKLDLWLALAATRFVGRLFNRFVVRTADGLERAAGELEKWLDMIPDEANNEKEHATNS